LAQKGRIDELLMEISGVYFEKKRLSNKYFRLAARWMFEKSKFDEIFVIIKGRALVYI